MSPSTFKTLSPLLPTTLIHQFPTPTWIENLAIRSAPSSSSSSNPTILVTLLTTPDLFLVSPTSTFPPKLLHTFGDVLALTGIIEVTPDVFYIAGGNFNVAEYKNEQGSFRVWEVDLRGVGEDGEGDVKVVEVCQMKESGLPNGMELFVDEDGEKSVLVADSEVGCVWKIATSGDGRDEKLIEVEEMRVPEQGLPMGINGIKIRDGFLYWSNTGREIFCRVWIDGAGKKAGDVEVLAEGLLVDDFCFDALGRAWCATNVENTVAVVTTLGTGVDGNDERKGETIVVAGSKEAFTVAGGTACQFGKKKSAEGVEGDEHVLYLVTTGGLAGPVKGGVEGGKVVGIDTRGFVG